MSSEMIERVALAIWRKREESFPGFTRRSAPDDIDHASGAWADMLALARTAIAAMRESTEAMMVAGHEHTADPCWKEDVGRAWSAMIDAALSPSPNLEKG